MKKGLFLLIAILTVGMINAKADIAAPVLADKTITVEIREGYTAEDVKTSIEKVEGVFSAVIVDEKTKNETCPTCEKCEVTKCGTSESLSDKDIESLKNATLIIYITLGILVVLMIVVIALMVSRRKKDNKKDA